MAVKKDGRFSFNRLGFFIPNVKIIKKRFDRSGRIGIIIRRSDGDGIRAKIQRLDQVGAPLIALHGRHAGGGVNPNVINTLQPKRELGIELDQVSGPLAWQAQPASKSCCMVNSTLSAFPFDQA